MISQKKEMKKKKAQDDKESGSSSSSLPSNAGDKNDVDSAFHSQLYGPESNIEPDIVIKSVLESLAYNQDMTRWFKRFLPEDDEEDKKSIERKYWQFREQSNLLDVDGDGQHYLNDDQSIGPNGEVIEHDPQEQRKR